MTNNNCGRCCVAEAKAHFRRAQRGGAREDAVVAGRAGGVDGVVGAHEAQVHGQQRARHVEDAERDAERIHLSQTLQTIIVTWH